MEFYEDDPVSLRKVLDMLTVANEFCLFLESAGNYKPGEVYDYLLKICPLLYLKGALLPEIIPADEVFSERFVTEEQWENVFRTLKQLFVENDEYKGNFFLEEADNESTKFSLSENFADIFQDLKDFVMLYQKRTFTSKENAVNQCFILFQSHWGPRILESLPRLHQLVYAASLPISGMTD